MTIGWVLFFAVVGIACAIGLLGVVWAVRTAINGRGSESPAWWAVLLAAAALLAVPVGVVATYFFLPVPISERTLVNSMERKTDSAGLGSQCSERRHRRWLCNINDGHGSGSAGYDVTAGRSCWHGSRSGRRDAETPMPERPGGCTTMRDILGILD
jgi:hypothetical protein